MTRLKLPFAALLLTSLALASSIPRSTPAQNANPKRSVLELDFSLDAQGRPLLAWVEQVSAANHPLFVQRLERGVWRRLGGALNVGKGTAAQGVFIRSASIGTLWAAWSENGGHADIVQFGQWDGQRWVSQIKMRQSIDLTYAARSRDLELEEDGTPLWVWAEINQTGIAVQTRRWSGLEWTKSAPLSLNSKTIATQPALATDKSGARVVVWLEGDAARSSVLVKRWNGKLWDKLGGPLNIRPNTYTFAPTVQLDVTGQPVVAWLEDRGGADTLYVKRWTGSSWTLLGDALNVDPKQFADRPSLTVHAQNQPCVVWAEGSEDLKKGYLKCFNGKSWQLERGKALNSTPGSDLRGPKVVSDGKVLRVVWRERKTVKEVYRMGFSSATLTPSVPTLRLKFPPSN